MDKSSVNFLTDPFLGDASFVDPLWYLCFVFVFVIRSCLFIAALWSPAGKGLTSWLSLYVIFLLCALSLSYLVSRSGVVLDCIDS